MTKHSNPSKRSRPPVHGVRLRRTTLVVPANRVDMIEKASGLPADVVMLDMEDAVVYQDKAKDDARKAVVNCLRDVDFGAREVIVRINTPDSPWFEADVEAVVSASPDAIVPAKLRSAADLLRVIAAIDSEGAPPDVAIWPGIETVSAVLDCTNIARADPRVELLRFGIGDYTVTMHGQFADTNDHLLYPLTHVLAIARDLGLGATAAVVVFSDIRRLDLIRENGLLLRRLGYDGATVIHPSHLPVINELFTPSAQEIEWALHQTKLLHGDQPVVVNDGRIVEQVNVKLASRTLALARELGMIDGEVSAPSG